MLSIAPEQLNALSTQSYAARMRKYLNSSFEESQQVPADIMEEVIIKQTKQARLYNITLETDLTAYLSAAWLLGEDFDTKFQTVKDVLQNDILPASDKAEFLWDFTKQSFAILQES